MSSRRKATEVTPEMVMRKTLRKLQNKEEKDAKRQKQLMSTFGYRFVKGKEAAQKSFENKAKKTTNPALRFRLYQNIEALKETSNTPWLVGAEALKEAKVINAYQSLLAKKRDIMRLYAEGGAVEELAAKRFQELSIELDTFVEELVFPQRHH